MKKNKLTNLANAEIEWIKICNLVKNYLSKNNFTNKQEYYFCDNSNTENLC